MRNDRLEHDRAHDDQVEKGRGGAGMRPTEPVGIAAAGLWLPEGRSLASDAVAAGRLRERAAEDLGHESLPDADVTAPPDAAVHAAHLALDAAGEPAERLAVLAHAWMYHQGHDLWSPAHYVARRLGAPRALPVGVQQVCNGGAAALGFVTAWLATADSAEASRPRLGLVTTADRFAEPGFDRWASDYGVAYGDGGTAVVLRRPAAPGAPHERLGVRPPQGRRAGAVQEEVAFLDGSRDGFRSFEDDDFGKAFRKQFAGTVVEASPTASIRPLRSTTTPSGMVPSRLARAISTR